MNLKIIYSVLPLKHKLNLIPRLIPLKMKEMNLIKNLNHFNQRKAKKIRKFMHLDNLRNNLKKNYPKKNNYWNK